jgi:large subunit ribosomal protein L18Ae
MTWLHQYQVVGRMVPKKRAGETAEPEETPVYRMRIFAPNTVVAKSRFWFFLRKLKRVKKANGEILSVNEIHEADISTVKNFGVWLRYKSRSDTVNMYKEYRDITMTGAVEQMYMEMSGRHRARWSAIQVLKVATVEDEAVRRPITLQMLAEDLSFPLPHVRPRPPTASEKSTFRANRPVTFHSTVCPNCAPNSGRMLFL